MVAGASTAVVAAVLVAGLAFGLEHESEPAPSQLVGVIRQGQPGSAAIEQSERAGTLSAARVSSNPSVIVPAASGQDDWAAIFGVLGDVRVLETQLEPLGTTGESVQGDTPGSARGTLPTSWTVCRVMRSYKMSSPDSTDACRLRTVNRVR
jgi:hypothetical protein